MAIRVSWRPLPMVPLSSSSQKVLRLSKMDMVWPMRRQTRCVWSTIRFQNRWGPWGPGGVGDASSLTLWLRGDQGTFTAEGEDATDGMPVAEWRDVLSGNVLSATQNEVDANPAFAKRRHQRPRRFVI